MSKLFGFIKISLQGMRSNKLRTFLTILGVTIGVVSIIVVYSAGAGIKGLLVSQVEAFGTNIIQTEIKVPSTKKGAAADSQSATALAQGVQVTSLKIKDVNDIKKLANIAGGYGAILSQENVSYLNENRKGFLFGVSADYINIDSSKVEFGRFYTDEEDRALAPVVVLGSEMKAKLFGDSEALGKEIKIRKSKFLVIGVMEKRGAGMGMNFDDYVYLPVQTLQKKIMGIDYLMYSVHALKDVNNALDTAEEVRAILRQNHSITNPDKDDFRVSTTEDMMKILNTVTSAITILLLAIVTISLIVGGVGILNVMYVVVSERSAEIGLRKAVGADFNNIMFQFLTEAVMISMLGAMLGTIIGVILSWLIAITANYFGLDWAFSIPFQAFVVVLFFSFVFGIVFGVYPARKAAKMDPIEALRRE